MPRDLIERVPVREIEKARDEWRDRYVELSERLDRIGRLYPGMVTEVCREAKAKIEQLTDELADLKIGAHFETSRLLNKRREK